MKLRGPKYLPNFSLTVSDVLVLIYTRPKSADRKKERFQINLFEISLSSQKNDFGILGGNTEPYFKSNINT